MKRILDVVGSLVLLCAAWPVMIVIAICIRFRLGSPVLFKQYRPGRHGRLFCLYKFRTMTVGDGDDNVRTTRIGAWLRRTSLDELPELWNVLRGDMSLVGPRPLLCDYLDIYDPLQLRRHDVKPGITGLAQVSGRNSLSWNERFVLDLAYVERQSLSLDLKLLIQTFSRVATQEGIAAPGHVSMPRFTGQMPTYPSEAAGTAGRWLDAKR